MGSGGRPGGGEEEGEGRGAGGEEEEGKLRKRGESCPGAGSQAGGEGRREEQQGRLTDQPRLPGASPHLGWEEPRQLRCSESGRNAERLALPFRASLCHAMPVKSGRGWQRNRPAGLPSAPPSARHRRDLCSSVSHLPRAGRPQGGSCAPWGCGCSGQVGGQGPGLGSAPLLDPQAFGAGASNQSQGGH